VICRFNYNVIYQLHEYCHFDLTFLYSTFIPNPANRRQTLANPIAQVELTTVFSIAWTTMGHSRGCTLG
jgi:hypothetical protein